PAATSHQATNLIQSSDHRSTPRSACRSRNRVTEVAGNSRRGTEQASRRGSVDCRPSSTEEEEEPSSSSSRAQSTVFNISLFPNSKQLVSGDGDSRTR
ncbi:hypothetical protein SOVF_145220, partial [Spinacia oleracea]